MNPMRLTLDSAWSTSLLMQSQKILNDPLIKNNNDLLYEMAASEAPVDLFSGSIWTSIDYSLLLNCAAHDTESTNWDLRANACNRCRHKCWQSTMLCSGRHAWLIDLSFQLYFGGTKERYHRGEEGGKKIKQAKGREHVVFFLKKQLNSIVRLSLT